MEFKDYYQVLGVPRDASAQQIKKSFRQLARKYHPDVSKEADAQARMREVNEAHAVLGDAERRAAYDALGSGRRPGEAFTPPPGWGGFDFAGRGGEGARAGTQAGDQPGDFSDFFAQMFGRAGAGAGGARRGRGGGQTRSTVAGEDHHAKIVLDLEDAFRGPTRQVTLRSPHHDAKGQLTQGPRSLDVKIPLGVKPGTLIRLAGQGGAGHGGAAAGDLLLEVRFKPHRVFQLDGRNLLAELAVAPWEAALGAVLPFGLPDGSTLKIRLPAGAQSGQALTVRGKGLPGSVAGDLELRVRVVLPSAEDPRARRLYEAMAAELHDFDARAQALPSGPG